MNVVAYCRVSTDKRDQLNSLETQKSFFKEYCNKNNYNLTKIYADEGISGTKIKKRDNFIKLLEDANSKQFEMVLVKDISRFARNTVDLLQSVRKLKGLDIEVVFLTANMKVLGQSEFVLTIFGALAQEESANISKRVKFGKKVNAEKGRVPNYVYGYNKTKGELFSLSINDFEASVVKEIFNMYIIDGFGFLKISTVLNEKGFKTKRNCKWTTEAVGRIIKNSIYTGKIINGKEEIKDFLTSKRVDKNQSEWKYSYNEDMRIIEDEIFDKAQIIMKSRNKKFKTSNKCTESNKYLFSSLIKCKECGWSFRRYQRTYKNTYTKWICSGRNGHGTDYCSNKTSIDESELIDVVNQYLLNIRTNQDQIKKSILNDIKNSFEKNNPSKDKQIKLKNIINYLNKKRKKYIDLYEDGVISRTEMKNNIGGILKQIEKCEEQINLNRVGYNKNQIIQKQIDYTFNLISEHPDISQLTNLQLKNIIDKIEVGSDGEVDIYLKMFADLNKQNSTQFCNFHT